MYKQVIAVRSDLRMSKGKTAVQVAHAALEAYKKAKPAIRNAWEKEGAKKVVVSVAGLDTLNDLKKRAGRKKLPVALIRDAGRTELPPGTVTCLGIGPADEQKIDKLTGALKIV